LQFFSDHPWELISKGVNASVEMLRKEGVEKFGCIGFCWGAMMAMIAGECDIQTRLLKPLLMTTKTCCGRFFLKKCSMPAPP
jgi:hypothetical protein